MIIILLMVFTFSLQNSFAEAMKFISSASNQSSSALHHSDPDFVALINDVFIDGKRNLITDFNAIKNNGKVAEDAIFGYRAAAPALLCNDSYNNDTAILWNPEKMQLVKK